MGIVLESQRPGLQHTGDSSDTMHAINDIELLVVIPLFHGDTDILHTNKLSVGILKYS
jgi:hypothetical protein